MLKLTVNLDERSYPIYIGQSALQDNGRLVHHIGDCRPIIITNDTIAPLYLQALLDSLADQIVTAVGVGVCAKMDMNAAVTEVNESNWSKFNYKGYPEFDENGKVKKGERYRKPDLKGMF